MHLRPSAQRFLAFIELGDLPKEGRKSRPRGSSPEYSACVLILDAQAFYMNNSVLVLIRVNSIKMSDRLDYRNFKCVRWSIVNSFH